MAARAKEALGALTAACCREHGRGEPSSDPRDRRTAEPQRQAGAQAPEEEVPPRARTSGGRGDGPARWPRWPGADVREILVRRELLSETTGRPARAGRRVSGRRPDARRRGRLSGVDIGVCDQETLDFASSWAAPPTSSSSCAPAPVAGLADMDLGCRVGLLPRRGRAIRATWARWRGAPWPSGWRGHLLAGHRRPVEPQGPARAGMGAQFSLPVVTEVEAGRPGGAVRGHGGQGPAGPAGAR